MLRTAPCPWAARSTSCTTRCCKCQPQSATLQRGLVGWGMAASFAASKMGGLGVRSAVMLAPSAYLASAASTATLVLKTCCHRACTTSPTDPLRTPFAAWQSAVEPATLAPVDLAATRQRSWDDPCCQRQRSTLLSTVASPCRSPLVDGERQGERPPDSRASLTATSGGLASSAADIIGRLADGRRRHPGWLWVCVSAPTCASHTRAHAVSPVDARGTHVVGLQREAQGVTPLRPAQTTSCGVRAACPGPVLQGTGRTQQVRTGKRPDGVSLIPWSPQAAV